MAKRSWRRGPLGAPFQAARGELGPLAVIAEDLGVITDGLISLRDRLNLPGMRVLQFAFETLSLHRIEVAIIPRNMASRRVVEKLALRNEGVALGFLEINGEWEDHVRYAMTAEEWKVRGPELRASWYGSKRAGGTATSGGTPSGPRSR